MYDAIPRWVWVTLTAALAVVSLWQSFEAHEAWVQLQEDKQELKQARELVDHADKSVGKVNELLKKATNKHCIDPGDPQL